MSLILPTLTNGSYVAAVVAPPDYAANSVTPTTYADWGSTAGSYGKGLFVLNGTEVAHDSLLTFSRSGGATVFDSNGTLKWGAHNLVDYSNDLTNVAWAKSRCSVAKDATGPDSVANSAWTLTADGSAGHHYVQNENLFGSDGLARRWGVALKAGTVSFAKLTSYRGNSTTNTSSSVIVDLSDGTLATAVGTQVDAYSITSLGSGWYLVTMDSDTAGNSYDEIRIELNSDGTNAGSFNSSSGTILLANAFVIMNTLGGMQDNPDWQADHGVAGLKQYVPTTSAAVYKRRVNHVYNGTSWVQKQLIEPTAATNLATESFDFTDAAWAKTNTATLSLDETGPDGVANSAVTLVDSNATGTGTVSVDETFTVSTSTAYTFSVFAKADQLSWIGLTTTGFTTPSDGTSYVNLSTGAKGTVATGHTLNVEDCGGSWYRCSITFTTDGTDTSGNVEIRVAEADTDHTVDLDGTSSILIYGAQFETGSVPFSYIPTYGATATRNAETYSFTSAARDSIANTTAISLAVKGVFTYADLGAAAQQAMVRWEADASNYIIHDLDTDGASTGELNANQNAAGTLDTVVSASDYLPDINVAMQWAARHTSGAINIAKDGTASTADTTPTALADLSSATLSLSYSGVPQNLELFRGWAVDLTDSGIAEASNWSRA